MASEIIKNNQLLLRGCILYEFTKGKQLSDAYKEFCKGMGEETMEYLDFEFWFMKFARGEFDLNYDRSLDPKYSRSLSDMPVEIIAKVMEKNSWKDVVSLRQVSQSFQHFVDDNKFRFKKLYFGLHDSGASLSIDNVSDEYTTEIIKSDEEDSNDVSMKTMKQGLHDLKILISIPKIVLEEFEVNINTARNHDEFYATVKSSIDLTGNVLKTRRICMVNCRVVDWLQCVEPGTLEEIEIKYGSYSETHILKNEQWKQAKTLIIKEYIYAIPIQHFIHFVCIDAEFHSVPVNYFLKLKNALFKSPNFKKCVIKWRNDQHWNLQELHEVEVELGMDNRKAHNNPYCYHFVIEHENKTFVIKTGTIMVEIERIS